MKKTFFDTLKGNFVKHFLSTVISLYAYELMQGIDPFHFDVALIKKLFAGGMVAFLPTIANYLNPNDPRFGKKK
ncbi:MAG TPA: hypothetical protein VGF79_00785 [Bacteroidia bacterium]